MSILVVSYTDGITANIKEAILDVNPDAILEVAKDVQSAKRIMRKKEMKFL